MVESKQQHIHAMAELLRFRAPEDDGGAQHAPRDQNKEESAPKNSPRFCLCPAPMPAQCDQEIGRRPDEAGAMALSHSIAPDGLDVID